VETTPGGPKRRTKTWSLYTQRPTLVADEAANLAGPEVVDVAGEFETVEESVSRALAVRYVPA
jgi:hypothetical protein